MNRRTILTKIWHDSFFFNLTTTEKLLFVYFLTNSYVELTGIFEIPHKVVQTETGISGSRTTAIKEKFEKARRFYFYNDWICISQYGKHNKFTPAPNIAQAFKREFEDIPSTVRQYFLSKTTYVIPFLTSKKVKLKLLDNDIDLDVDLDYDLDSMVRGTVGGTVQHSLATTNNKKVLNENINPDEVLI